MKARIILADPSWQYNNRHDTRRDNPDKKSRFGTGVAARYNHGVMSINDIKSLPIQNLISDDSYLFLWATWPLLSEALDVINAWGFMYITAAFVWVKTARDGYFCGPGRYTFSNSEPCLLAKREGIKGLWHPNTGWRPGQVILEPHPRNEEKKIIHSRKPAIVHEHLEKWLFPHCEGYEKIELFATQPRPGWVCVGGDVTGNDIRDDLRALSSML